MAGPRSTVALVGLGLVAVALFAAFVALGTWQVHRRTWKLDLIARVEQRVHAAPVAAPPPAQWPQITAANSEYRHVEASGTFLNAAETLVQATTDLGAGFWVLTPLRRADGSAILINRGFVLPERSQRAAHGAAEPTTPATVVGLLRVTEPKGGFLRKNDPVANHWYSRDVQAIAQARGLTRVAPYFIDADASSTGGAVASASAAVNTDAGAMAASAAPVGGLTVIAFHNSHLTYVFTWYTLALMVVVGAWIVAREERRQRRLAGGRGVA